MNLQQTIQHFKRFHWPIQNCWTAKGDVNDRPISALGELNPLFWKCIVIYWNILWNWMRIKSERYYITTVLWFSGNVRFLELSFQTFMTKAQLGGTFTSHTEPQMSEYRSWQTHVVKIGICICNLTIKHLERNPQKWPWELTKKAKMSC